MEGTCIMLLLITSCCHLCSLATPGTLPLNLPTPPTLHCQPHQQVALPELDGAIEPIVFAGRDSNTGKSHSLPDRIDALCTRAVKWASLRKKRNAEKRLAITVFSFPPDKGNVGTAAYLNVFCE